MCVSSSGGRFVQCRGLRRRERHHECEGSVLAAATWENFVRTMLFEMHRMGKLGFAVNFLTKPGQRSQPGQVYCTTPGKWARFCERELGRSIDILDDYGMDEFTLLARALVCRISAPSRQTGSLSRPGLTDDTAWPPAGPEAGRRIRPRPGRCSSVRVDRVHKAALFVISPDGHMDDPGLILRACPAARAGAGLLGRVPGDAALLARRRDTPMSWLSKQEARRSSPHLDRCCPATRGRPACGRFPASRTCCVVCSRWTIPNIASIARSRGPGSPNRASPVCEAW